MSSSPSAPPAINPAGVASDQQQYNTTAAQNSQQGSMVNQSNPFGSLTYSQTGTSANGTPLYTATTSLSPEQEALYQQYVSTQGTAGQQAGQLLSGANYGSTSPGTAIGNATSGLTQQAMNQEVAYLNPFFTQQTSQLDTQLRNQGFDPSSPAYQQAMNNLLQSQNQTTTGFLATIEPQMYQQAQSNYLLPLNMAESELGVSAPTTPNSSFVNAPTLNEQPADYEGAVSTYENAANQQYQAQLQQQNAMMSGLFGVPTAVLGGLAKSGSLSSLLGSGGGLTGDTLGLGGGITDADVLESLALV